MNAERFVRDGTRLLVESVFKARLLVESVFKARLLMESMLKARLLMESVEMALTLCTQSGKILRRQR